MATIINTKDYTANQNLIKAIRVAYRVAWLLPLAEAAEYVREIARAWRAGDRNSTVSAVGLVLLALGNISGTWSQWVELRTILDKCG